jgi:hypothetical protein
MYVLRRASRAVRVGLRALLRQPLGWYAHAVAAASAAYARKPHRPPRVWGLIAMQAIPGLDALLPVKLAIYLLQSDQWPTHDERQQSSTIS